MADAQTQRVSLGVLVRVMSADLTQLTGGKRSVRVQGSTVEEVIKALDREFPGIGPKIMQATGFLVRGRRVQVGNNSVSNLSTPIPPLQHVFIT